MIKLNLRLRISVAIASVCIVIVAALGIILYMASENMEAALVNQLVSEELNFLIQHQQINPYHLPLSGSNVQYYIIKNVQEESGLPAYLHGLKPGHYEIDIGQGKGDRDIGIREVNNKRFIVVYNIGPHETREKEFRQLILLSVFAVIVVTILLSYFLAKAITRQLTQLTQRVATLTPNASYLSFLTDHQDREVATLAKALDQYQFRINEMIKREQEFTANASHELRTPLTAIRTSCELITADINLTEKTRQRIGFISQAAEHMTEHIQALLLLGREKELKDREIVVLSECINDAVASLRDDIAHKNLSFDIYISPDVLVETNRQALHLVLSNLIKNAVHYTEQGFIRIEYKNSKLIIIDSGSGIAPSELPHIFDRNYRGTSRTDGLGIGLNIVKKICDQAGWDIEVNSVVGEGTSFMITINQQPHIGCDSSTYQLNYFNDH